MPAFHRRRRAAALLIWLVLLLALFSFDARASAPSALRVTFFDVGQGDAALLRDSSGFDVLIDGGLPAAGPGLVAALSAAGLDDLDLLVASHPDADHIGGLISVLLATEIPVERVLYNGYPGTTDTWNAFVAAAAGRGLTPEAVQFPGEFDWGEMRVYVLNPPGGLAGPDPNDASLVLRVDHGQVRFLFTGDISSTVEAAVLARKTPVAAQVLKVAHHGSAYSSSAAFLTAAGAAEAVISVGAVNSYGHPAEAALLRLSDAGSRTWRTDQDGTITVDSDGLGYTIAASVPRLALFLPLVMRGGAPPAPPSVAIVEIFYDGAGTSEPDEYVAFQNQAADPLELRGWTLRDNSGTTFTFPAFVMQPGQVCRVYTDQVHPQHCGFSYGRKSAIWNNGGDCASLRDATGQELARRCY